MDTKELERFCPWARQELVDAVMRGMVQLGVDEEVAAEDACKAEHILSEQTLEKIREYALLHDAQDSVK